MVVRRFLAVDCAQCELRVRAEAIADHVLMDDPEAGIPDYRITLLKCPDCNSAMLVREKWTGRDWDDWDTPRQLWPRNERQGSAAVPPIVQTSLDEAQRCHQSGTHTACAVMCGRALEGICVHFGQTRGIAQGLKHLRERGVIDERLFQWAEELRKHRNLAAHPATEKISKADSTDLLEFVNAITDYIFVLTAKFEAFVKRTRPEQTEHPTANPVAEELAPDADQ